MHSTGMTNIKVKDLSPELRVKLGYPLVLEPETPKRDKAPLSTWTKSTMSKMGMDRAWRAYAPRGLATIDLTPNLVTALYCCAGLFYVLLCYCGMLICEKTGHPPGPLVWIPVLQLIPLLRAAGMSPAWLLAFLVPFLNIIAQIVWSMNIARARGTSAW